VFDLIFNIEFFGLELVCHLIVSEGVLRISQCLIDVTSLDEGLGVLRV
jgi:hypothetical protein